MNQKDSLIEMQEKAWNLLESSGMKLGQKVLVRSAYASTYKNEHPFILVKNVKGIERFYSEIKSISNYEFTSKEEVILANAIYENTKYTFNPNNFIQQFKYTLRLLGVESEWSK